MRFPTCRSTETDSTRSGLLPRRSRSAWPPQLFRRAPHRASFRLKSCDLNRPAGTIRCPDTDRAQLCLARITPHRQKSSLACACRDRLGPQRLAAQENWVLQGLVCIGFRGGSHAKIENNMEHGQKLALAADTGGNSKGHVWNELGQPHVPGGLAACKKRTYRSRSSGSKVG